jgi:hypothetical protein
MNDASLRYPSNAGRAADDERVTMNSVAASVAGNASAVSWGAILAGAMGAAALSMILLILGVGLGLSSVSPFAGQGASATGIGTSAILWITFTQLAASGMGGYLAGRLRSRWAATHTDEVYFRDTAHGFLAWAVASLVTAALLSSAIGGIVGGGAKAGAMVAGGAATTAAAAVPAAAGAMKNDGSSPDVQSYFVDSLFRQAPGDSATATAATTAAPAGGMSGDTNGRAPSAEVGRIFASSMQNGSLSPDDARYVGQLIAQRTGISQADAEKRARDTFTRMQQKTQALEDQARDAAEKGRKASAYAALWMFVALLAGAFVASFCATFGGRRRDL